MLKEPRNALDDTLHDLEEEEQTSKPKRPGLPVEPRRVLRILAAERRILLRVFIGVGVASLVGIFFLPSTYRSEAQLLYEGTPLLDEEPEQTDPSAFVDLASSSGHLGEVRQRLGADSALDELRSRLQIRLDGEKSMRIVASGTTAEEAQLLAQTVVDVFLARQASYNAQRLETERAETARALDRAVERREQAMADYEAFRAKSGKIHLLEDQERLLKRIADLQAEADGAAVEVAAQQARIEELEKARKELPRQVVATATVGTAVDAPLAKARAELATARATLSEQHPRVQALRERVSSLEKQRRGQPVERGDQTMVSNPARDAVEKDLATARAALAAAEEREAALRVLIDSVKAEADALAPAEGEARQVANALEVADKRLQALTERATRLQDAAVAPITGFRVLSAPPLPEDASRSTSSVLVLLLLPIVVSLITGLVLIARGLRDLTIETPKELAWWGLGPVIGTSTWPRESAALESFVDELEDHGVHGAGRTLVVPATEVEREIACAFALRLSEAPWLAAAILDVEGPEPTLVTPPPPARRYQITPPDRSTKRLSSSSSPAPTAGTSTRRPAPRRPAKPTIQGFQPPDAASPEAKSKWSSAPPPKSKPAPRSRPANGRASSSRPPRKKTMIGLPAVGSTAPTSSAPSSREATVPKSVRGVARATVRMVVEPGRLQPDRGASTAPRGIETGEEEAFLLSRPVRVSDATRSPPRAEVEAGPEDAPASHAVMKAAIRLLDDRSDDTTGLRRSNPPLQTTGGSPTAVALAWNGPLDGPVLRRAARLAHRVLVVVSSGVNVLELTRVKTRLGREEGVGYALVNLEGHYTDLEDRVGDVEGFWRGPSKSELE